jgi:CheY-like chemotaxis protein/HPt (histidine-containing phosphotransfer) domain-containing protein
VGSHDLAGRAREAGLDACLVKPVRQSALYECLVSTVTGRSELNEAVAAVGSHQHRTDGAHHGNILLVEDNLINQAVALGMLNKLHGYNVAVAANGLEALQAHARHPFDLILMDCHMPEMDGYEATRQIRAKEAAAGAPHVPIVALTANAMAQDREDCLNAGMDDHLSKPFSRTKLADMLNKWMPEGKAPPPSAAAAAPANGGGPLDQAVLRQLSELQDADDPDLLARVVNLYVAESPKLVDKMRLAWAAADPLEMARAAHSLKSSSANVGAAGLAALCGHLQEAGQSGRLEEARTLLSRIDTEHPRVLDALRAELTS